MSIKLSSGKRGSLGMELGDAALAAKYAREAKEACESAKQASAHPPVIGENGNWQIWEQGSGYTDSGVHAEGPAGAPGQQGEAGETISDYEALENKPRINGTVISGDKTAAQLGLAESGDVPTKTSQLQNDAGFLTQHQSLAAYRTAQAQDLIDAGKEAAGLSLVGAAVGDLVRVNAVDGSGKPTSWTHVPLNAIATNDNLLDNWYFLNPVNQRGQNSYSNTGYTIDRWKLTSGSLTVGANGITLNGTLVQILERSVGLPVITSAQLSDGSMITPVYNDQTKTFTITATGQTIVAAKLEIGSEQTLAHQENGVWVLNEIPDYRQELKKCMYYYQRFSGPGALGYGSMQTTRRASVPVILPVMMRTPYTCTPSGNICISYSGGNKSVTVTLARSRDALAEVYGDLQSGATDATKGECVNLWFYSSGYIELSAEL